MSPEDIFYCQLAKTIQYWLRVESEMYLLYSEIMHGANPHLVSVTFHHIESVESKLGLIDSCLAMYFEKESVNWKEWRSLLNKSKKLNSKRNKIVHQPVKNGRVSGKEIIEISPSYFNALAISKGQTSFKKQVIGKDYKPSMAKILPDHIIDFEKLYKMQVEFGALAMELHAYRFRIRKHLQKSSKSARGKKNAS